MEGVWEKDKMDKKDQVVSDDTQTAKKPEGELKQQIETEFLLTIGAIEEPVCIYRNFEFWYTKFLYIQTLFH